MNKQKYKKLYLLSAGLILAIAVGGVLVSLNLNSDRKDLESVELTINEELIVENPSFVVTEMKSALGAGNLTLGKSIIDTNIVKAPDQDMADEMVYYFMEETETYGNMLISSKPEVLQYLRENKIKPSNLEGHMKKSEVPAHIIEIWNMMTDEMVEFKVGASESYINENYLTRIIPNYNLILKKYETYISEEMKDLIKMRSNIQWNYSKSYDGGFVPEIVEKNLIHQHEFLSKYPESKYARKVRMENQFLLQLYFGYIQGSHLFNEHDLTITPDAVKVFEKAAKMEGFLGEKAKTMVESLKINNNKLTPELLYVIEELGEVDGNNFSWYWNEVLGVEIRFDGPGRLEYSEPTEEAVLDPDTGEIIEIKRIP